MSEYIRTDLADGVLSIVLARPDKKNAITQAMYAALSEATERARTDAAVRTVGAGHLDDVLAGRAGEGRVL